MAKVKRTYRLGGLFDIDSKEEIEYTLTEMKEISNVNVDLEDKEVSFSFDPKKIPEDFIMDTINTLGYSVQSSNNGMPEQHPGLR